MLWSLHKTWLDPTVCLHLRRHGRLRRISLPAAGFSRSLKGPARTLLEGGVLISSARSIPGAAPRTGAFVLAALVASGAAFALLRRLFQRCFHNGVFFGPSLLPPLSTPGVAVDTALAAAPVFAFPDLVRDRALFGLGFAVASTSRRRLELLIFWLSLVASLWILIYILVLLDIGVFTWCHRDLGLRLT